VGRLIGLSKRGWAPGYVHFVAKRSPVTATMNLMDVPASIT
jgi:hypothetical protein